MDRPSQTAVQQEHPEEPAVAATEEMVTVQDRAHPEAQAMFCAQVAAVVAVLLVGQELLAVVAAAAVVAVAPGTLADLATPVAPQTTQRIMQ